MTTPSRSTREVPDDHLHESQHRSLRGDLGCNDPDLVVADTNRVFRGDHRLDQLTDRPSRESLDATFTHRAAIVAGGVGFLERNPTSAAKTVPAGADSCDVGGGRIVAQPVHDTIRPR